MAKAKKSKVVKTRKGAAPKTRNSGTLTESAFWSFIRSALRQKSRWWKPVTECKQNARRIYVGPLKRQKWEFQCNYCKKWFKDKDIAVFLEKFYIKKYKEIGHTLTNMNDGDNKPPSQKGKKLNHGQKILASTPLKKLVYQYNNDKVLVNQFISIREAGRQTGIDHRSIAEVANKSNPKRHRAGGYYWEYNII
jgi:hypothetical protein